MAWHLRRGELQRLRWRDVDVDLDRGDNRLRIVDSKTETGVRSIAVTPEADALERRLLGEPSTEPSTLLSAPKPTSPDPATPYASVPASPDRL